jgi:integrase
VVFGRYVAGKTFFVQRRVARFAIPKVPETPRAHLSRQDGKTNLLFSNRQGRALSADKLREKWLHPLLAKLGIEKGGFHNMRHGVASSLLAGGATPAVVQRQRRHSDLRITLGIYGYVVGNQQRDAVESRSARIARFTVNRFNLAPNTLLVPNTSIRHWESTRLVRAVGDRTASEH